MKKILSLALIAAIVASMMVLPSFAAQGKKQKSNPDIGISEETQKSNPDIGVVLEEPPTAPAEVDPEQAQKQAELEKWYKGLTEEQLAFVRSTMEQETKEQLQVEEQKQRNEIDKVKAYLKKNLANENGLLRVGVPSAKYIEKVDSLYQKYTEKTPNQVSVVYELCPASLKELEKAKSALEKNSQLQKLMAKSRMSIVIHKSCIELYCTDGTSKGFDSWLSANQYENLIQVRRYQKVLPTDSVGL